MAETWIMNLREASQWLLWVLGHAGGLGVVVATARHGAERTF